MNYKTELPPEAKNTDIVAIDSEWFGLQENRIHRPQGIKTFACCQFTLDGETAYIITDPAFMPEAYNRIRKATLVLHNAYFDYMHLRQVAEFPPKKKMWDIYLFEKILFGGYYSKFSLKDMVRRYFKFAMDKETRDEFIKSIAMTPEMLQYAAEDVCWTWRIYHEQNKIAREEDINIWYNVELPAFWPTIEFAGFPLNADKWRELALSNQQKADELEKTFPFNPKSHVQIKKFIREQHKIDLESSDEKHLTKIQNKCAIAKTILEYRHYKKRASTYGLSWLDAIEEDGRVHSKFNQIGADMTSRYSSDDINLQNVINKPEEPEYRMCFEAPPGYKLVIGDYQAQEPRILAYLTQDKELIKIFIEGRDIHGEVGMKIYETDDPIQKGDPRRKVAKALNLGLDYGLTPVGLKRNLEDKEGIIITQQEAEKFVNEFFSSFPQVELWIAKQRKFAAKNEYVLDVMNRKLRTNNYSFHSENNAINSPVQGSAAEMLKLALACFYAKWPKEWGKFGVVAVVHDEIDVLIPEQFAEPCRDLLQKCMEETGQKLIPGIPCKADVGIYQAWGEKE